MIRPFNFNVEYGKLQPLLLTKNLIKVSNICRVLTLSKANAFKLALYNFPKLMLSEVNGLGVSKS
jgi:hypothetical protein